MTALTLYLSPGSSSMAVHIALHEIGLPFESKSLSFYEKEHRQPPFLAINPAGKVPTLMVDGRDRTPHDAVRHVDERGCDLLEKGHGARTYTPRRAACRAKDSRRGCGDATLRGPRCTGWQRPGDCSVGRT